MGKLNLVQFTTGIIIRSMAADTPYVENCMASQSLLLKHDDMRLGSCYTDSLSFINKLGSEISVVSKHDKTKRRQKY